jgi:hypothetical protein
MAARRLSASLDLEAEMYRFEGACEAEKDKYSMMDLPSAVVEKQATVTLDALATCCFGMLLSL